MNRDRIHAIRDFYTDRHNLEGNWEDTTYIWGQRNPAGFYMSYRERRFFIEMLNKHGICLQNKKICDIGCGYDNWLRFFAELKGSSQELVGVDVTSHRVLKAKDINPGIAFIISDAASLPLSDASFDLVTQFDTFEHFVDDVTLKKAARELTRILRNHGHLIWFDLSPFPPSSAPTRGYSLEEVKALFPKFELIDCEPIFKRFNLGRKSISPAYVLPKFSYAFADLVEKIPMGKHSNLMVLMRKA